MEPTPLEPVGEHDAMATALATLGGADCGEAKKKDLPPRWKRGGGGGNFGTAGDRRNYFFEKAVRKDRPQYSVSIEAIARENFRTKIAHDVSAELFRASIMSNLRLF